MLEPSYLSNSPLFTNLDSMILDHLTGFVKKFINLLPDNEYQELKLPTSLSSAQLSHVISLFAQQNIEVRLKWFYPIASLVVHKNCNQPKLKYSICPIKVCISISPFIKDQLDKFPFFKPKKNSYYRSNEQFRSNFNILTYFNTNPTVPKFILKSSNISNQIFVDENSKQIEIFIEQISNTNQIQVISGLSKEDKLELIILLNNRCSIQNKSCRIVYLQCLSILTFWMALKAKEICNDSYWNIIGYQITLESKTSPNNSIIFFEMSTFIRALNRDLEMNLITHLIIDIDQNHLFFNLLLLYLKENINTLRHLNIFILTQNESQAKSLIEYFKLETLVSYINFADTSFISSYTSNVKQMFLDDILLMDTIGQDGFAFGASYNEDMERLINDCWQEKISIATLLDFLAKCPWLVNYQSNQLNGMTPLILAVVRATPLEVYQVLLLGADCHVTSWNAMEPIEWAIQHRREDVFQLLFTHHYATNNSFDINLKHYYAKKFLISSSMHPDESTNVALSNSPKSRGPPLYQVNYELILRLLPDMIQRIYYSQQSDFKSINSLSSLGSILILLPSYNSVSTLRKLIVTEFSNFEYEFTIFCLYPHVPNNELDVGIGILSSATNQVRVILSTFNVDSVFLDDIFYVINTGVRLEKIQSVFSSVNLHRLVSNQAIECQFQSPHCNGLFNKKFPIVFYNLFTKIDSANLLGDTNHSPMNICTDSMYHCIFAAKCFKFKNNKIGDIFGQMISQPPKDVVSNALQYLNNINVFDDFEQLTELGKILIDLSIEPHYAKMIIYSVILRCLDPILTIVCALSSPTSLQLCSDDAEQREHDFMSLCNLSHNSFSDQLTFVYAFQKWQELCRSHAKNNSKFDKNDIILFSSFEMIYSLRTKILGQLRAIGFVKGKGSMNIRQLNTNSDNFALVKAVICAGQPLDNFVLIYPNFSCSNSLSESIYLHPNSILGYHLRNKNTQIPSNFVLFDRKITCGQVSYIQNCTLINPLTVAIFADEPKPGLISFKNNCIEFGTLFQFVCEDIGKVYQIRQRWQQFAKKRLLNMQLPTSDEENNFIRDLIRLVTFSDESLGFGSHTNIGRAPQVMSTYFCSTVRVMKQQQQQ